MLIEQSIWSNPIRLSQAKLFYLDWSYTSVLFKPKTNELSFAMLQNKPNSKRHACFNMEITSLV